jgi:hypothetical protein
MKIDFQNQRGQAAVEYVLLLVVVISILTPIMGAIKDRFVGGEDCTGQSTSLVCRFQNILSQDPKFQTFRLRR